MRLMGCVLRNGSIGEEEREQRKVNKQIDDQLQREKQASRELQYHAIDMPPVVGSTRHTSTFAVGRWRVRQEHNREGESADNQDAQLVSRLQQMRILHINGFTEAEKREKIADIRRNVSSTSSHD